MNWWNHLKTINHHKWLVMKSCFRLGMYKQGLLHDLSKYSPTEFWLVSNIIRVTGVRIMQRGWTGAIPLPGSTTRAGISTIWNTGLTMIFHHLMVIIKTIQAWQA